MLSTIWSFCSLLNIIVSFIIFLVFYLVIIPYHRVKFYKDQDPNGIVTHFFPYFGLLTVNIKNTREKGDFAYYHKQLIKTKPDTRIICCNAINQASLQLVDPQLIKAFYNNPECYAKSQNLFGAFIELMGSGLVTGEGQIWKKHRKAISVIFDYAFLKKTIPMMLDTIHEFYDDIEKGDMKKVAILDEFQKITGENIGRMFAGNELCKQTIDGLPLPLGLYKLLNDCALVMVSPWRMAFGMKFVKSEILPQFKKLFDRVREFKQICRNMITKRRKELFGENQPTRSNMLDLMLDQQKNNTEDKFSDDEIVDELITFFFAGMDTTGHLAAMVILNLIHHPQYMEPLMKEVNSIYKGQKKSEFSIDLFNSMSYLNAVIQESLRFTTPVSWLVPREVVKDHYLGDIKVKAGTFINIAMILNNFNEKYHDEPEKFDPERFLDPNSKTNRSKKTDNFIFVPFSAGVRNCIGQHLSLVELKLMIAEFLVRYDFKLDPGYRHVMTVRMMYEPFFKLQVELNKKQK